MGRVQFPRDFSGTVGALPACWSSSSSEGSRCLGDGYATNETMLWLGLSALGLFGSIYHPGESPG